MKTIAQQIVDESRTACEALALVLDDKAESVQDWESGSTRYNFPDGSQLTIKGPEYYVSDQGPAVE